LVSKKVLSSIIGQVLVTGGVQFWAFFWTRRQPWYKPPHQEFIEDGKLQTINYENTVLFLVSSFQYILVAAVFSIGPPYRKQIWTNGLLMFSIVTLSLFSTVVLLAPPSAVALLLDLLDLPISAKFTLLVLVIFNVLASSWLEHYELLGRAVAFLDRRWRHRRPKRIRDGKLYKSVEGAMK